MRLCLSLALPLLLAACGDLPMPFKYNPGATALRLAAPPPTRLAVPTPGRAMLADDGAIRFATDLAAALDDQAVPAEAIRPVRGDWQLQTTATLTGVDVVPHFTVLTPTGAVRGSVDGKPVSAAAWANADAATLKAEADAAGPDIADLLTGIRAAEREADPHSLMHRPAKVFFAGVTGAPGDGNDALADAMRRELPMHGDIEVDDAKSADYTLAAHVVLSEPKNGQQEVELDWRVTDPAGHEAGKVSQLNAVASGTLNGRWGEVALAAASEAAGGVHEVIDRHSGRLDKPIPPPAHPQS